MGKHQGRRILIVEDEAMIALHIQSVLQALGWVVVDVAMTQAGAQAGGIVGGAAAGFIDASSDAGGPLDLDGEES